MSESKVVEVVGVDIDNDCQETVVQGPNSSNLEAALENIEKLIHNLKVAYDIKADKKLSDIIVAQELSLRELLSLINQ